MLGLNGWEIIFLAVLGIVLIGPDRMPEYAQKLAQFIFKARRMAEDAKGQLKDQLGDDYKDINWRQYDPRQYDPRRIVREALAEPLDPPSTGDPVDGPEPLAAAVNGTTYDPAYDGPVPYDVDAT